jgi:hypothetical protein
LVRRRPIGLAGPTCACGASAGAELGRVCVKCRARARWARRKARPERGEDNL